MSTVNDIAVLQAIFNPLTPSTTVDEPVCEGLETKDQTSGLNDSTFEAAIQLEVEGVKAAQQGALDEAIELFSNAIRLTISNASAYNNRAQAKQLKGDLEGAMQDVDTAIEMSEGKGVTASQSFCQRANLHKRFGHEKEALSDYSKAAELGNNFARKALVESNPMAALCNTMLRQVFEDLKRGELSTDS